MRLKNHFVLVAGPVLLLALALVPLASAQSTNTPVPVINDPLVPTTVAPGCSAFTLTVNGTGFVQGSVVTWNGSPRSTTFVSQSQLTAAILASDVAAPGTASITVVNPGVGTVSNTSFLPTTWPVSSISLVSSAIPSGVGQVVADFNGDGRQDLAGLEVNGNSGLLQVNLGKGDGTFQGSTSYPLAQNDPSALVVGDFNGDGKMDIAVAFGANGPPDVATVMLGNGDGTFQTPSQTATINSTPLSMLAADLNGDGKLDLAVSNVRDGTISVLLGNGDGTFQPQVVIALAPAGAGVLAAGDFNGDGKLDLAVCCGPAGPGQPQPISILLGNGDGTFQPPTSVPTSGIDLSSIEAADLNGDGKLDLVAASECQPPDQACGDLVLTPGAASVLLGNGDGTFQSSVAYTVGFRGRSVAVADINGDGIADLAVGTVCGPDPQCQFPGLESVSILLGNGDGTFQTQLQPFEYAEVASALGDFNGDGLLDMVATASTPGVLLQSTLAPSKTSLTFGGQTVGTNSAPQASTLSNISTKVPITVSSAQVSGTNASDSSVKTTCSKLLPKSACQVNVTFTPTGTGTRSAAVLVTDSAVGSPHQITVTGTGTAPVVSLSSTTMSFGTQLVAREATYTS